MKLILIATVALFVLACCVPALEFTTGPSGKDVLSGGRVLAVGWSGIFAGVVAWYANPIWILALVMALVGRRKLAAITGVAALLIGCTTFFLFGRQLPADEGGVNQMTLTRTLAGCYFWLASLATLPLVAFVKAK